MTLVPLYVATGCTIEKISNHFIIVSKNIYVMIDFLQKMYGIMSTEYFGHQLSLPPSQILFYYIEELFIKILVMILVQEITALLINVVNRAE